MTDIRLLLCATWILLLLGCRHGAVAAADAGAHPDPAAAAPSGSSKSADPGFTPDAQLGKAAEGLALDAVDVARESFGVTLDWTDGSILQVEKVLDRMYRKRAAEHPQPDVVARVVRSFGSYIGEVYRRNHGASWGMVSMGGSSFPGLETTAGNRFWPWGRVQRRLENGPEDNVADYYRALVRDDASPH
jgi:hypothetical protein